MVSDKPPTEATGGLPAPRQAYPIPAVVEMTLNGRYADITAYTLEQVKNWVAIARLFGAEVEVLPLE